MARTVPASPRISTHTVTSASLVGTQWHAKLRATAASNVCRASVRLALYKITNF